MMVQALLFVLKSLVQLWMLAVLLRFFAQATRAPFRARSGNPLADFIMALTDWIVIPARRLIPSLFKLDTASFVIAWIASALLSFVTVLLVGEVAYAAPTFWPGLIAYSLIELLSLCLYLYIGLLIVQAILSWLSPYHPLRPFFDTLTRPLLRPIQKLVPLIGGVDLSPLFAILFLQVALMAPLPWLGREAMRLMQPLAG
jgi:YggT family protein